jgi:type IV pilus assembly protein PilB
MESLKLGEILVNSRLITAEQCEHALKAQKANPSVHLGKILCEQGMVSEKELNDILDYHNKREKLGEILIKKKLISEVSLRRALSSKKHLPLGKELIKMNVLNEEDLAKAVAVQFNLDYLDIRKMKIDPSVAAMLKEGYARKNRIAPLSLLDGVVTLAVSFPLPVEDIKQLEFHLHMKVKQVISTENSISAVQHRLYNHNSDSDGGVMEYEMIEDGEHELPKSKYLHDFVSADAEFLVRKIISIGIRERASDIHLENSENGMVVRYRIDGALQRVDFGSDIDNVNASSKQIVSRIKILSDLDIAERRRPQDGSFKMKVSAGGIFRTIDFRVSTIPTLSGENVVLRILDKRGQSVRLETLGYTEKNIEAIRRSLMKPTGVFLVTGPTGSGKTSALYALLAHINTPETKTLTVEDPIEYTIDGVSQTEVHEVIGNTFARILRSFLRHDPDNIMVGEIRDSETAQIAIRAAITGHTVLSTLHTNDATSAITRLVDMGVDKSLIASSLRMVIAQRLVRKICAECSEEYFPEAAVMNDFAVPQNHKYKFMKGKGCPECNYSGYSGRIPIIEMWIPTKEELLLINKSHDNLSLRNVVFEAGGRGTLVEDGIMRVVAGETTLEELLRVVPYEQIESAKKSIRWALAENSR